MQPRIVPKYAAGKRPWDILRVFSEYFGDVVGSVFELFLRVLLGYFGDYFWDMEYLCCQLCQLHRWVNKPMIYSQSQGQHNLSSGTIEVLDV